MVQQAKNVDDGTRSAVETCVERGRLAMAAFANATQEEVDRAVTAIAWSLYEPDNARYLAEMAVRDTGLGNVADKIVKNQRKTFGTLRDLLRAKTVGMISDDPERGLTKFAKPVGVVAAVTPSTNPAATPINKAMMAVKGGNAVVIAPSPSGWTTTAETIRLAREELAKVGAPVDLLQVLPEPVTRADTEELMGAADLVVATGSQNNVRRAYSSGTPALGVGAGNVPVIIDTSADLVGAATKITASKTFDNATSCSSENSLVILDEVYDDAMTALQAAGGYRSQPDEADRVIARLFPDGKLERRLIAQDYPDLRASFELGGSDDDRYVIVEEPEPGADRPLTGEKLSLVLAVYRATDLDDAIAIVGRILEFQGIGHSVGIHTAEPDNATRVAEALPVVRVLVNQAHTFGNGGSFDNALPFTLSMGCGTWAGNSISENLNIEHFINITHLVRTIEPDQPTEGELFGSHWAIVGREPVSAAR
ncbi:MAG: aldehyde dehydrogenase family protein [Actinomycetia bacterium]|nr:aldehyde dehydrogenase family protein [Actinomycetes bacterium]MCP5032059.1 aldehyde dehydrogenase family protein [Actinomycetes bacterium]